MYLFREFFLLLAGGMVGSVLGTGFGALVGVVSPEFISILAHPLAVQDPERMGAAMGMIAGLLIGSTAMAAGRLIGALRIWAAGCRSTSSASTQVCATHDW